LRDERGRDGPRHRSTFVLTQPDCPERWRAARGLVEEYAASLHVDLGFQRFEDEIENLAREYGPPEGAFLLAVRDAELLGCVALRKHAEGVCEMKRLYVVPARRGHGVGRNLVEGIIARATELGYKRMVLDTLPSMKEARRLYLSLGFKPVPAYRYNPIPGTSFLERRLEGPAE
jgi:GNAT superfamily N-acetyltransferase